MRHSGPPTGLVPYLVLELLGEQPRYGYEILKEIGELSGGHWEPSYGSVYPILHRFEERGWTERVDRADEPDRNYFRLTDRGREALVEKRADAGERAREFADAVLGFSQVFVALATDDRFALESPRGSWRFDEAFSAWLVEQVVRHHERDFGPFDRVDATPAEFRERHGLLEE